MFNVGGSEVLLILLVALLVLGPKKLPDLAKTLGRVLAEFKRASSDVHNSVKQEMSKFDTATDDKTSHAQQPAIGNEPADALVGPNKIDIRPNQTNNQPAEESQESIQDALREDNAGTPDELP